MKSICFVAAMMLATPALGSPVIPPTVSAAQEDKEFQSELKKLSDEDRRYVMQYMMRIHVGAALPGLGAPPPSGVSIKDAIAAQKAFIAKNEDSTKAEDAVLDKLRAAVEVHNIRIEKADATKYGGDAIQVTATVRNISGKPIAGVKVLVKATNIFGDSVGNYGLKTDATIAPGDEKTLSGYYGGRQYLSADPEKITIEPEPLHVVFEDRTELKSSRRIIGL